MKLKLDENIGVRGQAALRGAGHDVATVHEEGLGGARDEVLARFRIAEERALVTLDLDFANPLRFPPDVHSGIAVLRMPRRAAPGDLDALVGSLIEALRTHSLAGRLWIVEARRIREYDQQALRGIKWVEFRTVSHRDDGESTEAGRQRPS